MKTIAIVAAVLLSLGGVQSVAAKGCLKGAAVGAVGGHVAGHHAILGAAAGCAIGHHMANKAPPAPARQPAGTTAGPSAAGRGAATEGLSGTPRIAAAAPATSRQAAPRRTGAGCWRRAAGTAPARQRAAAGACAEWVPPDVVGTFAGT